MLRANALGDFIVSLPAIEAVRSAYPYAEIVLLGKPWHAAFLKKGRTPVDRVIVVPDIKGVCDRGGEENIDEIETFIQRMQEEAFDLFINFQGKGVAANPLIKKFDAKHTVGCLADNAEPLDRNLHYYYYQSETIRFLELVQLIGASPVSLEPRINLLETDWEEIRQLAATLNKPFVVLHAVAVDVRRMWPIENYPALADYFREKDFEVVFTGDNKDTEIVNQIIDEMKFSAVNTCAQFGLGGLAALLSKASVVIGADTGPLHLARAVNAPTVGIYWAPNLINWGPVTRGNHRPVVSWNMHCPLCGEVPNRPMPFEPQSSCKHEVSFTQDVSIKEVISAAEEIFQFQKQQSFITQTVFV